MSTKHKSRIGEEDFLDDPCFDVFDFYNVVNSRNAGEDDYSVLYGNGKYNDLGMVLCGPANKRGIAWPNHARRIPRAKRLDELDEEI